MATLTTRLGKGSPVSFQEMDSNLQALDSDSPFRVAAGHIGYKGKVVLGPEGDSLGYVPTFDLEFGYWCCFKKKFFFNFSKKLLYVDY